MKKDFDVRGFLYEEVINECDKYKTVEEQIEYLKYVLKEFKINPPRLDPNGEVKPNFKEKMEIEIEYREKMLNGKQVTVQGEKIVWAKKREDFVALMDVLMNLNFILPKREKNIMLSDHFTWVDEEMTAEHIRQTRNNIKNKPELYKLSEEMEKIVNLFGWKN
ncbi:MAG: hypothetical protein FD143_3347 [Ignavibacteria bacterium]|nr:MAG: hypothetical protein FD143_3347 [Ignavibacteria bacterium]